jgi:hypothetical protein
MRLRWAVRQHCATKPRSDLEANKPQSYALSIAWYIDPSEGPWESLKGKSLAVVVCCRSFRHGYRPAAQSQAHPFHDGRRPVAKVLANSVRSNIVSCTNAFTISRWSFLRECWPAPDTKKLATNADPDRHQVLPIRAALPALCPVW